MLVLLRAVPWHYVNQSVQQLAARGSPAVAVRSAFGGKNSRGPPHDNGEKGPDLQSRCPPGGTSPRGESLIGAPAMATYYQYTPGQLNADELAKLHALPDDALLTAQEAAEVLRIKYTTLAWYRCNGGGPAFVRVGPKVIRYRMGDLRAYVTTGG